MSEALRSARVRVPGSTSNLGAGFDCVGLAVQRYLDAVYEPGPAPLRLERTGTLAAIDGADEDDLLLRAFRDRLAGHGVAQPGGTLRARSEIPLARGLGSSSAATVAGLALADRAAGADPTDRAALLVDAARREGHPDNAAPALFGGLVAVVPGAGGRPRALESPLSADVGLAYAAPGVEVSTARAREALPREVAHDVAVRTASRLVALLHGLAHADAEAIRVGFDDELHVPYRLPLIPGAVAAMRAGRDAGAWAVTISGAGSGLIAACSPDDAPAVADAMADALEEEAGAEGVVAFAAKPDRDGLKYPENR